MKKIYLLIIGILFISLSSAVSIAFFVPNSQEYNVKFSCENQGARCSATSICNISINYPNSSTLVSNGECTNLNNGYFNYTLDTTQTSTDGEYTARANCIDGIYNATSTFYYKVNNAGKDAPSSGESILYFVLTLIMFGVCITMFYFILVIPYHNERDDDDNVIKIVKLKYIKVLLIALLYPVIIITLNLMTGLAVNFLSLTIFSGIVGFLFEIMMRLAWIWTAIMLFWILYLAVRDTNLGKIIKQYNLKI